MNAAHDPALPLDFADLLKGHMDRAGVSANGLAPRAGCYPSYISRLMLSQRHPGPAVVNDLAQALALTPVEHNRLRVAAGYAPVAYWDETLQLAAETLRRLRYRPKALSVFRRQVRAAAAREATDG
jgi:hypothetical protein